MKKYQLEDLQQYAQIHNGQLLSEEYLGSHKKLLWQCEHGHRWEARVTEVVHDGQWCPICTGKRHRLSIYEMQDIAKSRGGLCVSSQYVNTQTKLTWKCAHGHVWEAMPQSIIGGSWCPICSSGLGERLTRTAFEQLLNVPFEKQRPDWLRTPDGIQLELDGYNEALQIAFEHQGEQHYNDTAYFAKKMPFQKRIQYDEAKRQICQSRGIRLFEIPQVGRQIKINDLERYLREQFASQGIEVFRGCHAVDYKKAYKSDYSEEMLRRLKGIAEARGGVCLSDSYKGSKEHHRFRCSNSHEWTTPADSILSGRWCPYCSAAEKASKTRNDIQRLRDEASRRGGYLVSEEYSSSSEKLEWCCSEGHHWWSNWNNIRKGTWCPECQRLSIEKLRQMAEERGGRLLSSEYHGSAEAVQWECALGHKWFAKPNNIQSGTWCPYCAGNRRLSIEEMRDLAKAQGGECLSSEYVNARTKLKWKCAKGHEWKAAPHSIKAGTWCPVCSRERRAHHE